MWWNFVARSRDEMDAAQADWAEGAERFGETGSPLATHSCSAATLARRAAMNPTTRRLRRR